VTRMSSFRSGGLGAAVLLFAVAASAAEPRYRILDLTERARPYGVVQAETRGINAAGEKVGFELLEDFKARAIYWGADGSVKFPPLLAGDNSTYAYGISESGVVTGVSEKVTVIWQGGKWIIIREQKAALWQDQQVINLNDLVKGGADLDLKEAICMNRSGQIVGLATVRGQTTRRGFLFDNGIVTDLGELVWPQFLNNRNQVVGSDVNQRRALLWDNGTIIDLHRNPPLGGVKSVAWGINDAGLIVGEAQWHISKPEEATLWAGNDIIRLVPEFNRPQGVAAAVNDQNQIAGFYINLDDLNDYWHGFVWKEGQRIDLRDRIPQSLGWYMLLPFGINHHGQVVGGGVRNGEMGHAFVASPVLLGDLNCDWAVNNFDIDAFVLALTDPAGYAQKFPNCDRMLADCNGDGVVDNFDIDPFVELLTKP